MSEVQISVIVPVYNAENYLNKCVDSILNQTETRMEIILVDDGSTDNSGAICDEYKNRDKRVKVIHQMNAGVSVARNVGLEIAQGEFIGFLDSDDWVLPEMYEKLIWQAERNDVDIVMCDAKIIYSNGKTVTDTIELLDESQTLYHYSFKPNLLLEMAGAVWRCIYSRKLIFDNNIKFPIDIKFSEDRIFNIYAMGYASKILYIKESYYMRLINLESVVHRFHSDYFQCIKQSYEITKLAIRNAWENNEDLQKAYLKQLVSGSIMAINNYFYKSSTFTLLERVQAIKAICNDKDVCNAVKISNAGGIRGKWILNKKVYLLCVIAQLSNWRYQR